jgi:hypothetical protein
MSERQLEVPADLRTKKSRAIATFVEPIYRRQPEETAQEYTLFLKYRDLPNEDRSMLTLSKMATGNQNLKYPHSKIIITCSKWCWTKRMEAWELHVQEVHSDRQERIVLELKSEVETLSLKMIKKIKLITEITSAEDLSKPEIQRDLAIIHAFTGNKYSPARFVLDAYRTVIGEKLQLSKGKALQDLEWKEQ